MGLLEPATYAQGVLSGRCSREPVSDTTLAADSPPAEKGSLPLSRTLESSSVSRGDQDVARFNSLPDTGGHGLLPQPLPAAEGLVSANVPNLPLAPLEECVQDFDRQ